MQRGAGGRTWRPGAVSAAQARPEFHEILDADSFEDLPGEWQAAILEAEPNRPNLRVLDGD